MVELSCVIGSLILVIFTLLIGVRIWLQSSKGVCRCNVKLHGKIALVTGGNSGIGLETARDLARRGARVVIAARNVKKSNEAVSDIIVTTNNTSVDFMFLDLAKFSSIKEFVENFNKTYDRLDILVNNAGCAGIKQANTENGIEKIMQINYVGPFLLTHLLMDKLEAAKPSRIVIVSSHGHVYHKFDPNDLSCAKPLDFYSRYVNSKLCNILWAKALAKHLPKGITANSLNPGLIMTDIFYRYSEFRKKILGFIIKVFFKSTVEGAQTSIHLSVAPELEGVSGEYFQDCKVATPTQRARDYVLVDKVWEKTMLLIKDAT